MASTKNILRKYQILTAQSISASFTGATPVNIQYLDNIAIQLNITTSDGIGTFLVQASIDYDPNTHDSGNWVNLVLSPSPTVASANNVILLDLNQLSFPWIRVSYSRTSGTGTVSGFISGKEV